jgi:Uma2 family endonuclease
MLDQLEHAPLERRKQMSTDEFCAWLDSLGSQTEGWKYELSDGHVQQMMTFVTRNHGNICFNVLLWLGTHIDMDRYSVTSADFGVRVGRSFRFPDVLVEPKTKAGKDRESNSPILICEVLSPSTMSVDFVEKTREYTSLSSLRTYLIISQDEPRIWVMARGEDGSWPSAPEMIHGLDKAIPLGGLDCSLPVSAVYRGVDMPEAD